MSATKPLPPVRELNDRTLVVHVNTRTTAGNHQTARVEKVLRDLRGKTSSATRSATKR
jgi:hypothetical protein